MSAGTEDSRKSPWFDYMKHCVKKYSPDASPGSRLEEKELEAVSRAIEQTKALRTGAQRMELLRLAYWTKGGNLYNAADHLDIDRNTARAWSRGFIRAVARNFFGAATLRPYQDGAAIRERPRRLW